MSAFDPTAAARLAERLIAVADSLADFSDRGREAPGGARVFATPAGVTLGAIDLIADGAARNFVLQLRAGRFHGFVVRRGHDVIGYVDRCPHMGLPLAQKLDDYVMAGHIACSWHGALFDVESGACVGGPCQGAALTPWPVRVEAGAILTV